MTAARQAPCARMPVSALEQRYELFSDQAIDAADLLQAGSLGAGQLMKDMNRMHQIVSGLGVVLRIVGGNAVLEDEFDLDNTDSPPPLSKTAESMLTAMAATLCEEISDSIARRASSYNREAKS
jgi:hypothetical protein